MQHRSKQWGDCTLQDQWADFEKVSGIILTAPDMNTHNTFDNPDALKPVKFDDFRREGDELVVRMPSKSIVALELS